MENFSGDPPLCPAAAENPMTIIEGLKQAIWKRRPILGEIMRKQGNKMLHRYAQDFLDVNPAPHLDARKPQLFSLIGELVAGRLGPHIAEGVVRQLRRNAMISTADHHAFIDHPFWVNSNLITGIPIYELQDPDIRYLIVLSFSSVSVNNASGFARGILFNGGTNGSRNLIRLPILPDKLKMSVVFGTRAFTREDLAKSVHELRKKQKNGEIAPGKTESVRALLEEHFAADDILGASHLCSQISRMNYRFWPRIFHPSTASGEGCLARRQTPDLVYFDIETLVNQLLLRHHLADRGSLLFRVLFDPQFLPLVRRHFDNHAGAFSIEHGWGTYMFWGINEKLRRVATRLESGKLKFLDSSMEIDWEPEAVAEALRQKRIFPGMLLCYLTVPLYYGMKCLGGFCQVHDLTVIKESWRKLLEEAGERSEAEAITPVQTKELGGDGMVLAYLKTPRGEHVPSTGIDMVLNDGDTSFEKYAARSRQVTLMEMMHPMLPEMYTVLYSEAQRDPKLLSLSPERIFSVTGLKRKLVAEMPTVAAMAEPALVGGT